MGKLAVSRNCFSAFAVWSDVIDGAVFDGMYSISTNITNRVYIIQLLTELKTKKSRFDHYVVEQWLNHRFERSPA